jgi:hypothetical protein
MPSLQQRLATVLADALAVEEPDGALTISYDDTLASVRVVTIVEGLDLVSLTQVVAWDLPLTKKLRDTVTEHAHNTQLGTVVLVEKAAGSAGAAKATKAAAKRNSGKRGDVMLRYNFPGTGLTDDALRTLVLLVLDTGAEIRRTLTG